MFSANSHHAQQSTPPPPGLKGSPQRTPTSTGLLFRTADDLMSAADPHSPQARSPPAPTAHHLPCPPPPPPPVMQPPNLHPGLEHLRLQQLYTLALADRMRFLHSPAMLAAAAAAQGNGNPFGAPAAGPTPSQAAMAHLSQLAAAAMAASHTVSFNLLNLAGFF